MRSALALALAFFVSTAVSAQPVADARLKPRPPQLMASENGQNPSPLSLAKADIRTVITGYLAETTMTLTFANTGTRVLEGELSFPLPENATISGYGLDINGVMVNGVPVERQKARITYEKEIRRRVDPGLVEQTVGNNFTTRVYPIPANGSRTIKVQYVSDITEQGDNAIYRLPLNWGQVVKDCTIRVEVVKPPAAPVATASGAMKLGFSKFEDRFVAEQAIHDEKLDDELIVTLPAMARPAAMVEKRSKTSSVDDLIAGKVVDQGEYFFAINDVPTLPVVNAEHAKARHIAVFWDASLSRAQIDKSRDMALLTKLLSSADPAGSVEIVAFCNEPDSPVTFPLAGGIEPIIKHLQGIVYDGGTNLSKLKFNGDPLVNLPATTNPWRYDLTLLFTDGLANLGPEMPSMISTPVYPISNDPRSNHPLLKRIAAAAGGVYFNLEQTSDEQALAAMQQSPYSLIGVDCNPAEVADIYPRGGQVVTSRVTISGRLLSPQAKVTLKYGVGSQVMKRQEFTLTQEGAGQTGLVSRYWAQQKVADLSSDIEGNSAALAAVGRDFNLVTPNSSLLVLDTVEQYLEHRIVPPKTRGDVYGQFMARIEQQKSQQTQTREERIAAVLQLWNGRIAWWNGQYNYAKDFKYSEPAQGATVAALVAPHPGIAGTPTTPTTSPTRDQLDALRQQHALVNSSTAATDRPADANQARGRESHDDIMRHPANWPDVSEVRDATVRQEQLPHSPTASAQPADGRRALARGTELSPDADAKKDLGDLGEPAGPAITIKPWDPAVPYLVAMREAGGEGAYVVYLKQRANFIASPAFYLDCADFLLRNNQKAMGIRVLTNIAELKLENAQLLRIVAHKLNQLGERELAISLFEKIATMRPDEPQSFRDFALALADRAEATLAAEPSAFPSSQVVADYHRALELLNKVVMTQWDRFPEIELTALMESNRIWSRVLAANLNDAVTNPLDSRLIKNLDTDVRIVLTWDADQTDVDLWVTEPSGEKCFYGHNRTTIGGMISRDFTQGYGPEEYCLRHAMPGKYKIQANYYGSSQQLLVGPCTVQATVITDFARPTEKRQYLTLRLTQQKDVVDVGTIELGGR